MDPFTDFRVGIQSDHPVEMFQARYVEEEENEHEKDNITNTSFNKLIQRRQLSIANSNQALLKSNRKVHEFEEAAAYWQEQATVYGIPKRVGRSPYSADRVKLEVTNYTRKINSITSAVLAIFGLILGVLQNDLYYRNYDIEFIYFIRMIVAFTSLILAASIVQKHKLAFRKQQIFDKISKTTSFTLWVFKRRKFWAEMLVWLIFTPPFVDITVPENEAWYRGYIKVDDILTICMFPRVYHIMTFFSMMSRFNGRRADNVGHLHNADINTSFIIHAFQRTHAATFLLIIFVITSIICSLMFSIGERSANPVFSELGPSTWMQVVTISSVGYGELVPWTSIARLVVLIAAIMGQYLLSTYITVISMMVEPSDGQMASMNHLLTQKLHDKRVKNLVELAVRIIQMRFRIYLRRSGIIRGLPILQHMQYLAHSISRIQIFSVRRLKHPDVMLPSSKIIHEKFSQKLTDQLDTIAVKVQSTRNTMRTTSRIAQEIKLENYTGQQIKSNAKMLKQFAEQIMQPTEQPIPPKQFQEILSCSKENFRQGSQFVESYRRASRIFPERFRSKMYDSSETGFLEKEVEFAYNVALDKMDESQMIFPEIPVESKALKRLTTLMQPIVIEAINEVEPEEAPGPEVLLSTNHGLLDLSSNDGERIYGRKSIKRVNVQYAEMWDDYMNNLEKKEKFPEDETPQRRNDTRKSTVQPFRIEVNEFKYDAKNLRKRNLDHMQELQ